MMNSAAEFITFISHPRSVLQHADLPPGRGKPVLVLPVIGRSDAHSMGFRAALSAIGHNAFGWELGVNHGPTPRLISGVEERLLDIHAAHGKLDIIGFSLGGIFARHLAHRFPDKVSQVITVCSPFRAPLDTTLIPLRPFAGIWRNPDLAALTEQASRPLPVDGTFLFSRRDGVVAWQDCLEPLQPQDCFAVTCRHVGITASSEVLHIVANRLDNSRIVSIE